MAALIGAGFLEPAPSSAIEIGFAHEVHVVARDRPVELEVVIDFESSGFADLFSFGLRLVPESAAAGHVALAFVEVPEEIDHLGFQRGVLVDRSPLVMGVKGNVGFSGGLFTPYAGTSLARFGVVVHQAGTFTLGLDLFRTAGPNEDVFLAGDGAPLDDRITFGTTTVTVFALPEVRVDLVSDGNDVRVRFDTVAGLRYTLRRSRDLEDWDPVAGIDGDGAEFEFLDVGAGGDPSWFYSVAVEPAG